MRSVFVLISVLLAFSACKKKGDNPNPPDPPVDNGPWGGVYKMRSTQTQIFDTLDSTPFGGGVISYKNETRDAQSITGSMVINKTNMKLENLGYEEVRAGRVREIIVATGIPNTTIISGIVAITNINSNAGYAISSVDSVKIDDAEVIVRIPPGDFNPSKRITYELIGHRLTFYYEIYRRAAVTINGQQYDSKHRSITVTEYFKQ